jgi:hypothetical protein
MGVDVAHLVLVALRDTYDEVLDDGLDGAEGSDVLAAAVVDLNRDGIFAGEGKADGKMGEVFCQFACWRQEMSASLALLKVRLGMSCERLWEELTQRLIAGAAHRGDFSGLPRGPSTVTMRDRMWILTFSGISSCSWE